jgi:catechol 2,3-dioxygenase-like lactoylglutathione lyase family enzyme
VRRSHHGKQPFADRLEPGEGVDKVERAAAAQRMERASPSRERIVPGMGQPSPRMALDRQDVPPCHGGTAPHLRSRWSIKVLGEAKQVAFVGVSDLDAAERFYAGVLGLALLDARPFALVHDTAATQLRITLVSEVRAAPYTVLGWTVVDLEGEMDRLVAAGVRFNRYEGMAQDDRGVWTTPDGARIAWFHDPDGNNLSLQS